MRFVTLNNSGLAWVEFEFELQEIQDVPSMFGDGLSFDQRRIGKRQHRRRTASPSSAATSSPTTGCSSATARSIRWTTSTFSFLITDFTPRWQFYIVQDPRIPSS